MKLQKASSFALCAVLELAGVRRASFQGRKSLINTVFLPTIWRKSCAISDVRESLMPFAAWAGVIGLPSIRSD